MLEIGQVIENMPLDEVDAFLEKHLLNEFVFMNAKAYIGLMNPSKYIQEYELNL